MLVSLSGYYSAEVEVTLEDILDALYGGNEPGAALIVEPVLLEAQRLWQNVARTVEAENDTDPIAVIVDLSPNEDDAEQPTDARRLMLRIDSGFTWAVVDGSDDNMHVDVPDGDYRVLQGSLLGVFDYDIVVSGGAGWDFFTDPSFTPSADITGIFIISSTNESAIQDAKEYLEERASSTKFSNRASFFRAFRNRDDIRDIRSGDWITTNVTSFGGFARASSVTGIEASNWDTSKVTNFSRFSNNTSLAALDVSNWDVSEVVAFDHFVSFTPLTSLDVSNWDVSKVVDFERFISETNITELDVSNWDTSSVQDFESFAQGSELNSLDVTGWNTANVTQFNRFIRATNITHLDISNWVTSNVTNFAEFARSSNLQTLTLSGGTGNPFADSPATAYNNAFAATSLTQATIDNILVAIESANTSNGTFGQSGGSAPSATGEAAIDALRARGWTVSVTGGY
jgi:surface protein